MILGITGYIGAGRQTLVEMLKRERGFVEDSIGDGPVEETIPRVDLLHKSRDVVVGGFRSLSDYRTFAAEYCEDFFLLAVIAERKLRWERIQRRNLEGDPKSWEEFVDRDEKHRGIGRYSSKGVETVEWCVRSAGKTIVNKDSMDEFAKLAKFNVETILKHASKYQLVL